ncbi:hypothetical protein Hanom_Chr13g01227011 [Helianthus anomalus]
MVMPFGWWVGVGVVVRDMMGVGGGNMQGFEMVVQRYYGWVGGGGDRSYGSPLIDDGRF